MAKPSVYFTKQITPEKMIELFKVLGRELPGAVAVKLHSGEVGNQNFIRPEFLKPIIDDVSGTVVECNTAYEGQRNTTEKHWATMEQHGWTGICKVDIMDEAGETALPIPNGKRIQVNYVGANLANYDSLLVLSHFKGHPMGGYGGALKNISIGIASSHGKAYIHGAGDPEKIWTADHDSFLESMADAAKSIMDHFDGRIAFLNVMCNLSVDCDCCAVAADPEMADIGILASLDPVALDQACLDLVYASDDPGKESLIERITSRNGVHTIEAAADLGIGSREYTLVSLDQ
ncbi:DUF362 domain-containing protein [Christensenella sp. MSJ-20]|uniref:DUF362 domain-containing protein n=1 Tax=Christensenella sp. MSJ-20 TaxID=2841518 RepID=UPI001C74001A|nr:DUF362 domain-containing protein [Christensenella sp. MSJ-20]